MSGSAIRLTDRDRAAKLAEAAMSELGLARTQLAELQMLPFKRVIAANLLLIGCSWAAENGWATLSIVAAIVIVAALLVALAAGR